MSGGTGDEGGLAREGRSRGRPDGASGSRRTFLKRSATAVAAASVGACGAPESGRRQGGAAGSDGAVGMGPDPATLPPEALRAVAEAVLPTELGADGAERAVAAFERWAAELEPVAELRHPYLVPEVRYSGPDPRPGWAAQLGGLDAECRKRHGASIAEVGVAQRRAMLARSLQGARGDFGAPAEAAHVALALMAHFYRSPEARDLCYGRAIGQEQCRGLEGAGEAPPALATGDGTTT